MALRLKRIVAFSQVALRSRLAWVLVCLHAVWFFLAITNMLPPSRESAKLLEHFSGSTTAIFAGRPFHFAYESLAVQFQFLVDLPSMIAAIPVDLLLSPLMRLARLDLYSGSYVGAGLSLMLASCQWLAVGKLLESWRSFSNWGESFLAWVQRWFALVAALVLLFTTVATPLVSAHSRTLAHQRHAIPSR